MGSFVALPIHMWMQEFGLNAFVETGTWLGAGIACARCFKGFEEFHSVDIKKEFYLQASDMFAFDSRVHVYHGSSTEVLPNILAQSNVVESRALFWLDAHLPQVYGEEAAENDQLPMKQELEIILEKRPRNDDLIIIDDIRLYTDDDFEHGKFPSRPYDNCDFVWEMVGDRYNISKSVWQTGFLILSPKP